MTNNDAKASSNQGAGSTQEEEQTESMGKRSAVAGKAPRQGETLGAAYFTAVSARQQNSMKSNLDTSNVQTGTMKEKAAEARAEQAMLNGSFTPSHIIKNTGLEAKASYYEAMSKYSGGKIPISQNVKNAFSIAGSTAVNKSSAVLSGNEDTGSQVAAGAITTGVAAYKGFKVAQTAAPAIVTVVKELPSTLDKSVKGIVKIQKGTFDVLTTAGRASVTVVNTAGIMGSGFIPFTARFTKDVLFSQAQLTGLLCTNTSQRIISAVNQIQSRVVQLKTSVTTSINNVKTGVTKTVNFAKYSFALVRGMVNGTVMTSVVAHSVLQKTGDFAIKTGLKGLKIAGKGIARGTVKGGIFLYKRGIPAAAKGISNVSMGVAGILTSSDDMMIKGAGGSIMLTNYGIKTSVVAARATGYTIKTTAKGTIAAVKGVYRAYKFVKQNGLRASLARAGGRTVTAVVNAGKSVVSAVLNLLKLAGQKIIMPLILIAVLMVAFSSLLSAPVAAVSSIFGGLFDRDNEDGTFTEVDIREFLADSVDGIPAKRTAYIVGLYDYIQEQLEENGGIYDYIRFRTNTQDGIIEPTVDGISSVFYTEEELMNIIQPIFNAILLKDYELVPSDTESKLLLTELFDKLFWRGEEELIEWCGQSAVDGSGESVVHDCGSVHAFAECPNQFIGIHGEFTCDECCFFYCEGHQGSCTHSCNNDCDWDYDCDGISITHLFHSSSCIYYYCGHSHSSWSSASSSGCYSTTYCIGCIPDCGGFAYCDGHDVLLITLNMDGLYQLLYEYFEQPIDWLENLPHRTPDEDDTLSYLKDTYEICLEYIGQIAMEYGGGLAMEDLSGVLWINGSRAGNQLIIDIALSQLGQVGGQPYWSWYGFTSRVSWCACFVSWCMNQIGHSEVRYSSCNNGGIPYFQYAGCWADGSFTDVVAGDVIFFDWNGDGDAEHTGLVIGIDDEYIYTVEGNSGDACRVKKYAIGSSVILGYGLMNY